MIWLVIIFSFVLLVYRVESIQNNIGSRAYYADLKKTPIKTCYLFLLIAVPLLYTLFGYSKYAFDILNVTEQERVAASINTRVLYSFTILPYVSAPFIIPLRGLPKVIGRIMLAAIGSSILIGIVWTIWPSFNDFIFYFFITSVLGLVAGIYMYSVRL